MTTRTKQVIANVPCAKCPFRRDVPIYLHRERRIEIANSILSGSLFYCHGSVDYDSEEENEDGSAIADVSRGIECAGAVKAALADGTATKHSAFVEGLGMVDLDVMKTQGAEVWPLSHWQGLAEGATADNPEYEESEGETCSVVNSGCLAPAGYAVGGGVVYGTEYTDGQCTECWEPVCENCSNDNGVCYYCAEGEE